jgi:hypothetical protein
LIIALLMNPQGKLLQIWNKNQATNELKK